MELQGRKAYLEIIQLFYQLREFLLLACVQTLPLGQHGFSHPMLLAQFHQGLELALVRDEGRAQVAHREDDPVARHAHIRRARRGSSRSRSPSPRTLIDSTMSARNTPGKSTCQNAICT